MFFRRKSGPLISASCERPGLRFFLLIGLFCLTFSAFWWNFERRMEQINPAPPNKSILNEDGLLLPGDVKNLDAWREKFSQKWNVPLVLQASKGELKVPEYSVDTLYVGAGFSYAEGVISVPPLVRKVIGEGARLQAEEALSLCLKKEPVGPCISSALQSLWNAFEK